MADNDSHFDMAPPPQPVKKLGLGVRAVLQIVFAILSLVFIYYLALTYQTRKDLSEKGDFTVSEATENLLRSSGVMDREEPIKIIAALRKSSPHYSRLRPVVDEYERLSKGKVKLEYLDPIRDKDRAFEIQNNYGDLLADKRILSQWLHDCLTAYQAPADDVVEVIALDQSSKDCVPEFKVRCVRPMKRTEGMGHEFFLERSCSVELLTDACTWFGQTLRCYLITGPPGTGKTELTIWLAGYLKLPLYRLSLNDSRLTDQLFAQLVSPTGMSHDNVVLQIDEFQETLQRWGSGRDNKGVSMGGFCEVLQGSNSLTRGFIILSGTEQLSRTMRHPTFAAVFRRVAVDIMLSSLSTEDLHRFFCHFIGEFVPSCPPEMLKNWAERFTSDVSLWGSSTVTIDMVKQFLMKRISSFRAQYLLDPNLAPDSPCLVPNESWDAFAKHLTDRKSAEAFLAGYPPVHEVTAQSDCHDP